MARWSPSVNTVGNPGAAGEGVARSLYGIADALGDWQGRRRSAQERNWRAEIEERRYADATSRADRDFALRQDQAEAAQRIQRQNNALRGVYDELDEGQQIEDVEQFDQGTGEWAGLTPRFRSLGPGLGYQDVTTTPTYVKGRQAFDSREDRERDIAAAIRSGMTEAQARALAEAGNGQGLADVLEEGAKLPFDLERDTARFTHQERLAAAADERRYRREMDRVAAQERLRASRGGGGATGTPEDLKDREAVVSRQIDDARAEQGIAAQLDLETGRVRDPERLAGLQQRLDSLNTVRDRLASGIGNGAGEDPPTLRNPLVDEVVGELNGLQAKREAAIDKGIAEGMTPEAARRQADRLYNEHVKHIMAPWQVEGGTIVGRRP